MKESMEGSQSFERGFMGGESLFGYDRAIVQDGKIIGIKSSTGEKPDLTIGSKVRSRGKIRTITNFCEPFTNGSSDYIIGFGEHGEHEKPSEVEAI